MAALQDVTDANFQAEVIEAADPVLVDFWVPWCGPCRVVGPVLEEIAEERHTCALVKLNVDDNQETAAKYEVLSIPTMILFKNGAVATKIIGAYPKRKPREGAGAGARLGAFAPERAPEQLERALPRALRRRLLIARAGQHEAVLGVVVDVDGRREAVRRDLLAHRVLVRGRHQIVGAAEAEVELRRRPGQPDVRAVRRVLLQERGRMRSPRPARAPAQRAACG